MTRRQSEERPLPAHPYRDSAIVYGVMAVILVVLAGITGGSLVRATVAAIIFWLGATGWSWWKFRRRIRERELAGVVAVGSTADVVAAGAEEAALPAVGRANGTANGTANGAVNGNGRGAGTGGVES
jgi:hypothetical protein